MTSIPLNIPNILTIIRLLLVPFFIWMALDNNYPWAIAIFILAEGTDVLDGYLARKTGQITSFGKLADPAADKLLQAAAVVILAFQGKIIWLIPVVLIFKEFTMILGGLFFLKKNLIVSSKWYGKTASIIFFIAIALTLFEVPGYPIAMWAAMVFTFIALVLYAFHFIKIYMKHYKKDENEK